MAIARTDQSAMGRWWWTVDRWTVLALVVLFKRFQTSPAGARK